MESLEDWGFNLRLFIQSYKNLGYFTEIYDWNVRCSPGRIVLDNHSTKASTTFIVEDGILDVEIRPWLDSDHKASKQNIDLRCLNSGWRNVIFLPLTNPAPEAVAFLQHLFTQGYCHPVSLVVSPPEDEEDFGDMDIPCY